MYRVFSCEATGVKIWDFVFVFGIMSAISFPQNAQIEVMMITPENIAFVL